MARTRTRTSTEQREGGAPAGGRGFTLVEMLVVIVIIGIIIVFILIAAADARRRAEEAATLSLITKLETGLNDWLDALLQYRPDANWTHFYLSANYVTPLLTIPPSNNSLYPPATQRSQVIALYDYIKSELPDVFYIQNVTTYPLNFAGSFLPGTTIDAPGMGNVMLPLGNSLANDPANNSYGSANLANRLGTGIFGASYNAAAGIYKNLGYLPAGFDGIDNNGNGLIDERAEGVNNPPNYTTVNQAAAAKVAANLAAHKHSTARAEMLFAVLVEGIGPLGAVFSRDDFTDREVQDTDNDGLPEFVDAWGQPLQFFRWPLLYHSDTQRGQTIVDDATTGESVFTAPYASPFEAREQNVLDPNQQLVAPAWWSSASNDQFPLSLGGPIAPGASSAVSAFEYFFHRLSEPLVHTGASSRFWDRGSNYPFRRAFFSTPLIVSSGPDKQLGLFLFPDSAPPTTSLQLLQLENNAIPFHPEVFSTSLTIPQNTTFDPSSNSGLLREAGRDDISNQNRQSTGGIGGS